MGRTRANGAEMKGGARPRRVAGKPQSWESDPVTKQWRYLVAKLTLLSRTAKRESRARAHKMIGRLQRLAAAAPAYTDKEILETFGREVPALRAIVRDLEEHQLPTPEEERTECGAKIRGSKKRCRSLAMLDSRGVQVTNGRCQRHGGGSTGPRTTEGRARVAAATTRRHRINAQAVELLDEFAGKGSTWPR